MVQEYIDTDNCENQDLTTEEVYILAEQILGILIYLESQNIVHKDIKPANILWDNNKQQAYLIDFGFSSLINSAGVSSTLLGTVGFMSPEQLFKGKISHQGDLYSLGATIYVILSHISIVELPKQISNSCHIPVNYLYYEIPTPFLDWLNLLVATDPKKRFKNAKLALAQLIITQAGESTIQKKEIIFQKNQDKNSSLNYKTTDFDNLFWLILNSLSIFLAIIKTNNCILVNGLIKASHSLYPETYLVSLIIKIPFFILYGLIFYKLVTNILSVFFKF